MRKLLLATTALFALTGAARADVVLTQNGGMNGTGDNVVFDSADPGGFSALGHLNDPGNHSDVVRFTDLAGTAFSAAAGNGGGTNGNDVKISSATKIGIALYDSTNSILQGTTRDVFSLSGTGTITMIVNAVDANGVAEAPFNLPISTQPGTPFTIGNGQSFFELQASNGEVITGLEIIDTGGSITDFEHYRIDSAAIPLAAAVPEASTWLMFLLGFASIGGISMLRRRETGRAFRLV